MITVSVCRGCCCGQLPEGVPDTTLDLIRAAASEAGARVRTAECLGPCEEKDVVVVQQRSDAETRTVNLWLGGLTDPTRLLELCDWIATGAGPLPGSLERARFSPPRSAKEPV
ncbi:MAG TPA: hypothetical protein VHD81_02235 [Mycobacteriales bacterium]|nr:hypothetical protein [Mycobacteriales bacterium]